MRIVSLLVMIGCIIVGSGKESSATLIPFDVQIEKDPKTQANSQLFKLNTDADPFDDITFSTTGDDGLWSFNIASAGSSYRFLNNGTLGCNSIVNNPGDLRIDFDSGAVNSISFGFALARIAAVPSNGARLSVFDATNNLLGTNFVQGDFWTLGNGNQSSSPEGFCSLDFGGIASYAIIDVTSIGDIGRPFFIMDNLSYTPVSTPEPGSLALSALGCLFIAGIWYHRKRSRRSQT